MGSVLHTEQARSNMIGQYFLDYKQKPESFWCQDLHLTYRFCIHMQYMCIDYCTVNLNSSPPITPKQPGLKS